jgi:CRP/FNR family transcriptional activator FtrB
VAIPRPRATLSTKIKGEETVVDSSVLEKVPAFAAAGNGVLASLSEAAEERDEAAQTALLEQGGRAEHLHVLVEGQIGLTARAADGRTTVVEVVHPVDTFFLAAVLNDAPYLMGAVTLAPSRVLRVPAAEVRRLVDEHPPLARSMLGCISRHYRTLVAQVKDLKLRSSTERLACYLLSIAREHGVTGEFRLPYDKRILAGRLGMTPENLSRAFATLRGYGVETHGSRVALHDRGALERFAAPDLHR